MIKTLKLENKLRDSKFELLASLAYPYASKEVLYLAHLWNTWLFFVDDFFDRDPKYGKDVKWAKTFVEKLLNHLNNNIDNTDITSTMMKFTSFVGETLKKMMSVNQFNDFILSVKDYLNGSLQSVQMWAKKSTPSIKEYLKYRLSDSGMLTVVRLIGLANKEKIRNDYESTFYNKPKIKELIKLASLHVSIVNDILSYEKEKQSKHVSNLVHIIFCSNKFTEKECVNYILKNYLDKYLLQIDIIKETLNEHEMIFYEGLRHWMVGNVYWSIKSGRYCSRDSMFIFLRKNGKKLFESLSEPNMINVKCPTKYSTKRSISE